MNVTEAVTSRTSIRAFLDKPVDTALIEELLAKVPDVDSTRVAEIKSAIADGSYQVDPEKIVDKLLQIEKDFS